MFLASHSLIALLIQRRTWNHGTGRNKKRHTSIRTGILSITKVILSIIAWHPWWGTWSLQYDTNIGLKNKIHSRKKWCHASKKTMLLSISIPRQRTQSSTLNNTFHDKTNSSPFSPKGRFLADSTSTSISWASPIWYTDEEYRYGVPMWHTDEVYRYDMVYRYGVCRAVERCYRRPRYADRTHCGTHGKQWHRHIQTVTTDKQKWSIAWATLHILHCILTLSSNIDFGLKLWLWAQASCFEGMTGNTKGVAQWTRPPPIAKCENDRTAVGRQPILALTATRIAAFRAKKRQHCLQA